MVELTLVGMTVAAIVVLGYPIFVAPRMTVGRTPGGSDDLQSRKLSVYRDIKDLEFDLEMGKVSETDYEAMRTDYETEAVDILEAMDRSGNGRQAGETCPVCGEPVGAQDRFCGACGHTTRHRDRSASVEEQL